MTKLKLTITVPSDSSMDHYLSNLNYYLSEDSSVSVTYLYHGDLPPLLKITELLALFDPVEYTISKNPTGISFIVLSLE